MLLKHAEVVSRLHYERVSIQGLGKQLLELESQHKTILTKMKKHKIDAELIRNFEKFFTLEEERTHDEGPTVAMMNYLKTLSNQLFSLFTRKKTTNIEESLFRLLIRFNFNKECIYEYYKGKIEEEVAESPSTARDLLRLWEINSNNSCVRSDMSYNPLCFSLSYDMNAEVDRHFALLDYKGKLIYPIMFNENIAVVGTILRSLYEVDVICKGNNKTRMFNTLGLVIRNSQNRPYESTSVRNSFQAENEQALDKSIEIVQEMLDSMQERKHSLGK